ncbi:hypothetical protein [Bradyrhizobium erythrophlei]|uniref:Uncharacterized protein n=1 Tax=Bradyrhizobium erythrophlei TaxID=1437360 RepID=A0A1M7UW53_9BRAD|nr:hypothetical protein [Bradyrhizobium erythrophlei]SHN87165.1 hypothetical protein SAMN05444170_7038 [Bradyrhizobium erythrophlei]
MAVRAGDLAELTRLDATPDTGTDLSVLETIPAVYAYLIACARADHDDEGDACELLARHSGATSSEVRSIAATLRRLGYRTASDRLRLIAGRRRRDLRPL